MGEAGFEPAQDFSQGILSPQRLPFRHSPSLMKIAANERGCTQIL